MVRNITAITRQAKEEIEWFLKEDAKTNRSIFTGLVRLELEHENLRRIENNMRPINRIDKHLVKRVEKKLLNDLSDAVMGDNQEKDINKIAFDRETTNEDNR